MTAVEHGDDMCVVHRLRQRSLPVRAPVRRHATLVAPLVFTLMETLQTAQVHGGVDMAVPPGTLM